MNVAELKKLNTRFYSEVLRKKFFVLYEDSRQSLTHPRDHHSDEEDEDYEPARLEYYNNRRNWEAGERPRRVIILRDAFTITRKRDTRESFHKFVIAIYTVEACLGIVFDDEETMETWLEMLISCQMGGRSVDGRLLQPKYKHVYEVDVQHFEPDLASNTFQMSGPHRLVLTSSDVKFFAVGSYQPICFLIKSIRGCKIPLANRKLFKLCIGGSSESGSGELVMKCADEAISDAIRVTLYDGMRSLENNSNSSLSRNHRGRTGSSRTTIPFNSNNMSRTNSWSNVEKKSGLASSLTNSSSSKTHHQRQHSAAALMDEKRQRTTSEGNSHFELNKKIRGGKSITSGSPMSPGSFISSESAGSSNSLDDTIETMDNRMVTPIDDYVGPATIFEESSAESCLEQTSAGLSIVSRTPAGGGPTSGGSADTTLISSSSSAGALNHPIDINVNYTPIDIIPSLAGMTTGTDSAILASSPPGNATHYSTILTGASLSAVIPPMTAGDKPVNDYMIMSPPTTTSSTKKSVKTANDQPVKHKPLSGLIDEFAMNDESSNASNVTSPNSQSSYNPLLDMDVAGTESNTEDSNAYMVMSPATSSSGGGSRMGTGPRKISQHIKSNTTEKVGSASVTSEDYMDMSPASKGSVPIPNRNERALSFGTSPSAALTSHLVDYMKTSDSNSTTSDYLIMSPVDPDKNPDFKHPSIKLRTSSVEDSSQGSSGAGSGARPKTRGRIYRGQSDSQRSSMSFDEHWELGFSPQESSGATLMGPEINELDYAPLDIARSVNLSKAKVDSLNPKEVESKLRLDDFEDEMIDEQEEVSKHPRAYSVGCRGSNSSVSTTGSGSSHWRHHKSRFIDIPGATTASGTSGTGTGSQTSSISPGTALISGQSPSTITSRLGSWIRHRTGSVPSKSAINGRRRHRTQSEGEKDEV